MIQYVSNDFRAISSALCDATIDAFSADFIVEFAKLLTQLVVDSVNHIVAVNHLQALLSLLCAARFHSGMDFLILTLERIKVQHAVGTYPLPMLHLLISLVCGSDSGKLAGIECPCPA